MGEVSIEICNNNYYNIHKFQHDPLTFNALCHPFSSVILKWTDKSMLNVREMNGS